MQGELTLSLAWTPSSTTQHFSTKLMKFSSTSTTFSPGTLGAWELYLDERSFSFGENTRFHPLLTQHLAHFFNWKSPQMLSIHPPAPSKDISQLQGTTHLLLHDFLENECAKAVLGSDITVVQHSWSSSNFK